MVKEKMSFTIERNICDFLRNKYPTNMSEKVNEILEQFKDNKKDVNGELVEIEQKQLELEEKKKNCFLELETQIDEGNKKQREEAAATIRKQEYEKEQKKNKILDKYTPWYELIEKSKAFKDFKSLIKGLNGNKIDFDDLKDWVDKLAVSRQIGERTVKLDTFILNGIVTYWNDLKKIGVEKHGK